MVLRWRMTEKTKAYITKYALTKGIEKKEVEILKTGTAKWSAFGDAYPGEWFLALEDAQADAEKRRWKKIDSLKKQLEKLEKMRF